MRLKSAWWISSLEEVMIDGMCCNGILCLGAASANFK